MDRDAFLDGFRSAFSMCGGNWPIPDLSTGPARDAAALAGDWANVGIDLQVAMDRESLNERQ
jgi:hypothetical protein